VRLLIRLIKKDLWQLGEESLSPLDNKAKMGEPVISPTRNQFKGGAKFFLVSTSE
jgi:hypothetical protein